MNEKIDLRTSAEERNSSSFTEEGREAAALNYSHISAIRHP
jgi:hypothetical protein